MDMPSMTGTFTNLRSEHTYKDMILAIYEGIVFEHTRRIGKLKSLGFCGSQATLSGGGAYDSTFCQLLANCCGLNIRTTTEVQAGALGGAIVSAVATGIEKDLNSAVEKMVHCNHIYEAVHNEYLSEKYERFISLLQKNI